MLTNTQFHPAWTSFHIAGVLYRDNPPRMVLKYLTNFLVALKPPARCCVVRYLPAKGFRTIFP